MHRKCLPSPICLLITYDKWKVTPSLNSRFLPLIFCMAPFIHEQTRTKPLFLTTALRGLWLLSLFPTKGKCLNAQEILDFFSSLSFSFTPLHLYLQRGLGNHIKSLICTYTAYSHLCGTLKESFKLGGEFVLSYLFLLAARIHQVKLPLTRSFMGV